jgi:HK97 family phage major capsid protein
MQSKTNAKLIGEDITRVEAFLTEERVSAAAGTGARAEAPNGAKKPWESFGEQLSAVAQFSRTQGRVADDRLYAAALGANESTPAEGGFLVAPEFTSDLIKRTYEVGEISSRCASMEMKSNRVIVNAVDEDSRVDGSRWGGLQAFWLNEAGTYTPSKPKFRQMQFIANKLTGLMYATDEQLEDSTALGSYANDAFPKEFAFKIDDAVFNGTGAGQPLGVLNSGAVIAVAAEGGQATATIVTNNILKMWARLFATSRKTACWLVNQDVEPQLYPLTLGTGTAVQLLYMPAGTTNNPGPYAKLMGRDVIPVEQCATLGTQGDIVLADFQQYVLAKKAEMKADTSIHVAFLTGEQAFRFQLRVDGQPTWKKPLTPKNGANTLSAFISLATRP